MLKGFFNDSVCFCLRIDLHSSKLTIPTNLESGALIYFEKDGVAYTLSRIGKTFKC